MTTKFSNTDDGKLYDVVCLSVPAGKELWRQPGLTLPNAEAVELMAIIRQGVEDRFFKIVAAERRAGK